MKVRKLILMVGLIFVMVSPSYALKKNVASQTVCAELLSVSDGSPVTSSTAGVDVYYIGDNGSQTDTAINATHKGNGTWCFQPSQAQTNYTHVAYTFVDADSVAMNKMVQVYTTDDIWGTVVESTYSYADYMRLSAAVLFGDWTMAGSVATFRDVPDTKDRVVETLTSGERDVTSLTGN